MRESSVFRDSREAEDTGLEHIKYQNEYQPRASEAKAPGRGTSFFFFPRSVGQMIPKLGLPSFPPVPKVGYWCVTDTGIEIAGHRSEKEFRAKRRASPTPALCATQELQFLSILH